MVHVMTTNGLNAENNHLFIKGVDNEGNLSLNLLIFENDLYLEPVNYKLNWTFHALHCPKQHTSQYFYTFISFLISNPMNIKFWSTKRFVSLKKKTQRIIHS